MYESTRRMLPILNFSAALNHQPLPLHGKADLLWKSQHPLGFPPTLLAAPFSVFLCIFFSRAINYWISLGSVLWPFLFLFDVLPYGFNYRLNAENSQIYITTWEHSSELQTHIIKLSTWYFPVQFSMTLLTKLYSYSFLPNLALFQCFPHHWMVQHPSHNIRQKL